MREHPSELATLPPTRRQVLSRPARDAGVAVHGTCVAIALSPRPHLPAARAVRQRMRPHSHAYRSAAPWPLRRAVRVVTE